MTKACFGYVYICIVHKLFNFTQYVTLGIVGVGLIFSIIFHIGTEEPSGANKLVSSSDKKDDKKMHWYMWFRKPQFYLVSKYIKY